MAFSSKEYACLSKKFSKIGYQYSHNHVRRHSLALQIYNTTPEEPKDANVGKIVSAQQKRLGTYSLKNGHCKP